MENQVAENETKSNFFSPREDYLKSVVLDPKKMGGVWEVKIGIHNTQGVKAFGGRMVTDYIHPITGLTTALFDLNHQRLLGYMIDRPTMVLRPDTNPMDRRIVDWLLGHPEVGVEGISLTSSVNAKKQSNPNITLKNVDRQEMAHIESEDFIDRVIGRISDDNPKTGISLKALRYLLAHFNLPYFDVRYIENKTTEKRFLRQKLKAFARGLDSDLNMNAEKVDKVLSEIENLKYNYEFKEMLRLNIVKESFGSYKYNNVPLGSTVDSAILWFKNNIEIYTEMSGLLYAELKKQGF